MVCELYLNKAIILKKYTQPITSSPLNNISHIIAGILFLLAIVLDVVLSD